MNSYLLVFFGGGLGSLARYATNKWVTSTGNFPYATLTANVLSSLILGIFLGYMTTRNNVDSSLRWFIAAGFCGGFSTFSTFSAETFELFKNGMFLLALTNIFLSVVVCLVCIGVGVWVGKLFFS